jgi:DNA-directed RNA polymerase subunit M/transcription elongation factor TFIIS
MSNSIRTCPGCDSLILSDTYECPECGHVFDSGKADVSKEGAKKEQRKHTELHDPCPTCGEMVRSGLVRCWKCNSFMRKDVAEKYKSLTSNPQPIIFSDIPADQRTEFIPPRTENRTGGYGRHVFDAEDDSENAVEFTLKGASPEAPAAAAKSSGKDTDFELNVPTEGKPAAEARTDGPDQPKTETAGESKPETAAADAGDGKSSAADSKPASPGDIGIDDLVGIAMKEQRETRQRRRDRLADAKRKRVLIPCACGAWVRVHEDQSGRVVRCRQCKRPMTVPEIRKKDKAAEATEKQVVASIDVDWIEGIHLHVVKPTDLVLKPGSLEKSFDEVDLGFAESGVHLVKLAAAAKKKGLFGGGKKSADAERAEMRQQVRDHVAKTGGFADLPAGEVKSIDREKVDSIRIVQPVAQAHESMFAGVPVFGEGRIAVYLPLDPGDDLQAFCSFPLSEFRKVAAQLKKSYSVELPAAENGIPVTEEAESLSCFYTQTRVEALKNLVFYENDPGFELELSGHRCAACGIAVTEEARAKNKLGGANGKSLAKAKCPKCSSKFGSDPLYKLVSKPKTEDAASESEVSAPGSDKPAAAGDAADAVEAGSPESSAASS